MRNKKYLDLVKDVETTLNGVMSADSNGKYSVYNLNRELLLDFTKSEFQYEENNSYTKYDLYINCHIENSILLHFGELIVYDYGNKISIERDGIFKHIEIYDGSGIFNKNLLNADQIREKVYTEFEDIKKYAYIQEKVNYKDIIKFRAGLELTGKEMNIITFDEIDEVINLLPQVESVPYGVIYKKTLEEFCNGDEQKFKIIDRALMGNQNWFVKSCIDYKYLDNVAVIYDGYYTEDYYILKNN